jgi:peptidoglycan hydrolase-like protein with peptidoglycan-binding domain
MLSGVWDRATWRPVSYIGEADPFGALPLGWVLHVVVGNGSPFNTFENAPKGKRKFSHLWVAKDGKVEQYQRLERASWAQAGGNPLYWSVETEGFPSEALTGQQLDVLAAWHVHSGGVDAVATSVGAHGIGTHQMGGVAWGNHSCPGTTRAAQRGEILRRAQILRGTEPRPLKPPIFPLPVGAFYGASPRSSHSGFGNTRDRGNIRTWQARMRLRGWTIGVDGLFGPETENVARVFQREKHLAADGLVGRRTWDAAWVTPIT